ncbi:MAG: M6 family metalloprotease domain-containing protein [Planctomycetales bacterium]|nr:M6 family metalloprotease domain-containing protein [Planctomycetales bacterium]
MAKVAKALCAAAVFLLAAVPAPVMAVPACPEGAPVTQPDGTEISVYLRGDEYAHWNESREGYQIIKNGKGEWVYMVEKAGAAAASEHAVGKADPEAVNALKPDTMKLSERGKQNRALRSAAQGTFDQTQPSAAQETPSLTQTAGIMYNLVVLVNFSDLTIAYPAQDYDSLFNQIGYTADGAVGSVKDYYHEVSYNALTVQSVVPEPVTLGNGYAFYGANNPFGEDVRPREMVAQALAALEARGFDFGTVDGDGDGQIDGLTIIHAGGGEEYGGNDPDYIWSHQWALSSPVTYDGVTMQSYHTEPARRGWDSSPSTQGITRIGVICHETGHFLGLPDLYDYGYDSEGAGNFCLMAGGSWNGSYGTTPAHMSAWCKCSAGWIAPTVISADGLYSLGQAETNAKAYKLQGIFPSTQYFLIENRRGVGFDAGLPGSLRGILIWHVDETQPDNDNQTHYKVDLEEASGIQHLELNQNAGNDLDYFRFGNATVFNETSAPNNVSYSGQAPGLNITDVSSAGTTMNFQVGDLLVPMPPVAADVNERTILDTSITVTLDATDDGLPFPPGALSYIVASLPNHGTLADPSDPNTAIVSVPRTLSGNEVIYTPRPGCGRPAVFTYLAGDGGTAPEGGESNAATVMVSIARYNVIYSADMGTNPGWGYESDWAWGTPAGSGGAYGNPDPASGHTGTGVVGYNLAGDYKKNIRTTQWAATPAIDCTGRAGVALSFYRWLNVEGPAYDHAYVQVSNNGSTWTTLWQNTSEVTDSSWTLQTFDISAAADNQPTVYIRWGMGTTDGFKQYSGWNIDDVTVTETVPATEALAGDFEPDCDVDVDDLMRLVYDWLAACGDCGGTDLVADGIVNLTDLRVLADNWLAGL